jgi:hypothetical protein
MSDTVWPYHGFLASDMPLSAAAVLSNNSDSRPDLMIFERALTFVEDDSALNSLVMVWSSRSPTGQITERKIPSTKFTA